MSSVTAFSGTVPQNYDTYLGPLFFEPYALDLAERIGNPKYLNRVLELACGTGRLTKPVACKLSDGASLVATDLNNDMIEIGKKQVQNKNIEWKVADAHSLPFENERFDLVVCQFGVMFFQDKPKAFSEINRVLKAGGTFLFNTWNELQYNALSQMAQTVLEEICPDDPPRFLQKGPYSLFDKNAIQQLLQDAGFANITVELVAKTGVAATADDAVNGILDGTPNYAYMTARSIPVSAVKEKLKAMLTGHYGEKNLSLPMEAFVVIAKKG